MAVQAELLEAKVEGISKDKSGLKIGESWYNLSDVEKQSPEGGINRGDTVKFKWSKGKDSKGREGKQVRTTITVTEKAPKWDGNKGGGGGGYKKGGWKEDPKKQASIEKQAMVKAAAELVAATLTGKSKPLEAAALVVQIAEEFFHPYVTAGSGKTAEKTSDEATPASDSFESPEGTEANDDLDDDTPF